MIVEVAIVNAFV